jgi:hypothetical protein
MPNSTSDHMVVLLGGKLWTRKDLDDLPGPTIWSLLGVLGQSLTRKRRQGMNRDTLWQWMVELDQISGEELVRRKIEAGQRPRRGGRKPNPRRVKKSHTFKLNKNAMPLPTDRERYFVPIVHDHGYWAPIPDMSDRTWDNDLIIEVRTLINPCQTGSDTWVLFNLLITEKFHGKTIRDWKVMDDPQKRNTIGRYRRMAMHRLRYFVHNGWVWLRYPDQKEDDNDGST